MELSESDSSSIEEEDSSSEEEHSMTYDSESGGSDKSSDNSDTEEEAWKISCSELNIIDNLNNIKSNIKEHKLTSNNLDTVLMMLTY